jgi:hypothetical protein
MTMPKIAQSASQSIITIAAFASLVICGTLERAFADPTVNVVNPPTQPVITSSVDNAGRTAYQSAVFGATDPSCSQLCVFAFPAVPTGHRLVIQHVSGGLLSNANPGSIVVDVTSNPNLTLASSLFIAPVANRPGSGFIVAFDQPVLFYLDAGSAPQVSVTASTGLTGGEASNQANMSLMGYLLDCSANLCNAIAH